MAKRDKKHLGYTTLQKRIILFSSLFIFVMIICSFSSNIININTKSVIFHGKIKDIGLPNIVDSTFYVVNLKGRYSYLYSNEHRQSKWVAYMLTKSDLEGRRVKRATKFNQDSVVLRNNWNMASNDDYYRSNFDRGHLLPSADRNKSVEENRETFLLTNISPQKANLNRNVWASLENQIRNWAKIYDTLYIVTGTIIKDETRFIGKNKITIPNSFYKVILSKRDGELNAIGFIIPNDNKTRQNFMKYCKNIARIEKLSGVNFYSNLPDSIENILETSINFDFWSVETDSLKIIK